MSNGDLGVLNCGMLVALRIVPVTFPSVSIISAADVIFSISEERVEGSM